MSRIILGVDEAGRGPLAGPVAVGVVAVPARFNFAKHFPGLGDSKELSESAREELYERALLLQRAGSIRFVVRFSDSQYIDKFGITRAVRRGVWSGVRALAQEPKVAKVFLDGLLKAPPEFLQETVIKGDALVPVISLASIVAKVRRDKLMERIAEDYPRYRFEVHKGYGTARHRALIARHGLCDIHRRSFCMGLRG